MEVLCEDTCLGSEKASILSAALIFYVNFLLREGRYGRAAHALWNAWKLNPESVECNMYFEKFGIFTPLNLEDVTVKLTLHHMSPSLQI